MRNTLREPFFFISDLMSKQLLNTVWRSKNGNESFVFNPDSETERESQGEMRGWTAKQENTIEVNSKRGHEP